MNYNQLKNLSCYEEFEILSTLTGISKVDILKEFGYKINNYYFFISEDGIFNWYDLGGNHVEDPAVLKEIKDYYIPKTITKCVIPNSVINIGNNAFFACYLLTSISIPDSVTSINIEAFSNCKSLKEIIIPNSVTSIGHFAFWNCKSLKEIVILDNITHIGHKAFSFCESLKEVIFKGKTLEEVKQMENYPFGIEDESIIKCDV